VVVLLVGLEVFGQVGDAFRQDRDLNLGRAGVASGAGVIGDDLVLAFAVTDIVRVLSWPIALRAT